MKSESECDEFNLERFLEAQNPIFENVLKELTRGRKTSHWMWFVFPQLKGLGRSSSAIFYGIASKEEALAFVNHPILGPRLLQCVESVNGHQNQSLLQIFGSIDALKFRSSMTLFAESSSDPSPFREAIDKYCLDGPDPETLKLLSG